MISIFSYSFILRAFIVGILVSLTSSLIGVSLVLRRLSMIGDGLSHVAFGALGVATLFSVLPFVLTVPIVIIAAVFLLSLSGKKRSSDASIALLSSGALAIGVIAISLSGENGDLNSFLFGSVLAISKGDGIASIVLSAITLAIYIVFYHQIYITTFDMSFAKATGIKADRYTLLLAILSAVTIVVGMRILGALLISSLIIFPAMFSMKIAKTYFLVTILSAVEALFAFVIGFFLSYYLSLPTGASVVVVHIVLYVCASVYRYFRNLAKRKRLLA